MPERGLTWIVGALLLVAASDGTTARAQTGPPLQVNTLSSPKDLAALKQKGQQNCGLSYSVAIKMAASPKPVGTITQQEPKPGTPVSCGTTVQVTEAGIAPIYNPNHPIIPLGKPTFKVGDLALPGQEAVLERESQGLCGSPAVIETRKQPSPKPEGSYVSQDPPAGTVYTCATRVVIWVAAPPPPPPRYTVTVGDLSRPGAVDTLKTGVSEACDGEVLPLSLIPLASTTPKGSYITQRPPPNSTYACNTPVVIFTSLGPPPQVPDTDGQPTKQPAPTTPQTPPGDQASPGDGQLQKPGQGKPGQGTSPPTRQWTPPPRFVEVPDLSTQQAVDTFSADASQACGKAPELRHRAANAGVVQGGYLGQDPAPETVYSCGEPVTVWHAALDGWLLVAVGMGAALSAAGTLGWRSLHPNVGLRAGMPAWSASPRGPIPQVELEVEGAAPQAAVRGDLPIGDEGAR